MFLYGLCNACGSRAAVRCLGWALPSARGEDSFECCVLKLQALCSVAAVEKHAGEIDDCGGASRGSSRNASCIWQDREHSLEPWADTCGAQGGHAAPTSSCAWALGDDRDVPRPDRLCTGCLCFTRIWVPAPWQSRTQRPQPLGATQCHRVPAPEHSFPLGSPLLPPRAHPHCSRFLFKTRPAQSMPPSPQSSPFWAACRCPRGSSATVTSVGTAAWPRRHPAPPHHAGGRGGNHSVGQKLGKSLHEREGKRAEGGSKNFAACSSTLCQCPKGHRAPEPPMGASEIRRNVPAPRPRSDSEALQVAVVFLSWFSCDWAPCFVRREQAGAGTPGPHGISATMRGSNAHPHFFYYFIFSPTFSSLGFPLPQILFFRSCFISSLCTAQRSPTSRCTPGALPALPGCKLSTSCCFFLPKKSKKNEKKKPHTPKPQPGSLSWNLHLFIRLPAKHTAAQRRCSGLYAWRAPEALPEKQLFPCSLWWKQGFLLHFLLWRLGWEALGGRLSIAQPSAHHHVLPCSASSCPQQHPFIPKSEISLLRETSLGRDGRLGPIALRCCPHVPSCCCPWDVGVKLVGRPLAPHTFLGPYQGTEGATLGLIWQRLPGSPWGSPSVPWAAAKLAMKQHRTSSERLWQPHLEAISREGAISSHSFFPSRVLQQLWSCLGSKCSFLKPPRAKPHGARSLLGWWLTAHGPKVLEC